MGGGRGAVGGGGRVGVGRGVVAGRVLRLGRCDVRGRRHGVGAMGAAKSDFCVLSFLLLLLFVFPSLLCADMCGRLTGGIGEAWLMIVRSEDGADVFLSADILLAVFGSWDGLGGWLSLSVMSVLRLLAATAAYSLDRPGNISGLFCAALSRSPRDPQGGESRQVRSQKAHGQEID